MENMTVCVSPIRHKNLNLWIKRVDVKAKKEKTEAVWRGKRRMVESALREWNGDGSVILYCPTVKDVKRLHRWLKAKDWKAVNHHGKMADSKRTASQAKFLQGDTNIMVATNAFDLGIDKPDVRLIIHAGLPLSMDGYVQEIGRVGRDGKAADCLLIYALTDVAKNKAALSHGVKKKRRNEAMKRLNALNTLARSKKCIGKEMKRYFGEKSG
ncbi:hypothetical protein D3Z52_09130 [Clostridiaceae bacterium]|nr:hypothetical protein [Clostridiaceae bacterium]